MNNIVFSTFQDICRLCTSTNGLKLITDNYLIEIMQLLSGSPYSKTDLLPHQICSECIETITGVQAYSFRCKQTHHFLTKILNNHLLHETVNAENKEVIEIKQEAVDESVDAELVTEHFEIDEKLFAQMIEKQEIKEEVTPTNCLEIEEALPNKFLNTENGTENMRNAKNDLELELIFEFVVKDGQLIKVIPDKIERTDTVEQILKPIEETFTNPDADPNEIIEDSHYYKCDICIKVFESLAILEDHKLQHNGKYRYECDVCHKKFVYSSFLSQHKRIHSGERPYRCHLCDKSYTRKHHLNEHIASHSGKRSYQCNTCNKCFKQSSHLNEHKRIHSGERPFPCNQCTKKFISKSHLEEHKARHDDKRRYVCNICEKGFNYSTDLNRHKLLHSGKRPYKCDICLKTFCLKSTLVKHMERHTDAPQFICEICSKGFHSSCDLIRHKRVHNGERPFACDICDKRFSLKSNLGTHKATHNCECNICNKSKKLYDSLQFDSS